MNIFKVTIEDLDDPMMGLKAISIVDFPAVKSNFLRFKDDEQPRKIMLKADGEQHIITGVALLADTPIYRCDPAMGGDYYIVFERETIKKLVQKYSKDGLLNIINLQHNEDTYSADSCVMIESYFVNQERGICPIEFAGIPDGSWVVSFKVTDNDLWQRIKEANGGEGELNGFSVEVVVGLEQKMRKAQPAAEQTLDEVVHVLVPQQKTIVDEFFSVTRGEVNDAMMERKQIDITYTDYKGDEINERVQIKEIGKVGNTTVINVYVPKIDVWRTIAIEDIASMEITGTGLAKWNYDAPTYKTIENDPEISVTNSGIANRENIEACIEGQFFAMIEYDDETESPATGMRQVQVCAYGTTLAGNECFRAYEYFGDTSSSLTGGVGNWRLFLTKRCLSFIIMTEAQRWSSVPPGYRTGDVDMTTIYKEINPGRINPYPAATIKR